MKTLNTLSALAFCIALAMFASIAHAQSPAATDASPDYFIAMGAGFNSTASPSATGLMAFGVKLGDGKTYTTSSVDLTARTSTFRQGIERVVFGLGPLLVTAKGDAGIATASAAGSIGGSYAGGGSVIYSLAKFLKGRPVFAFGSGMLAKSAIGSPDSPTEKTAPVYRFGIVFPLAINK